MKTTHPPIASREAILKHTDGEYAPALHLVSIDPWDGNPRKMFDKDAIEELARSIAVDGVQQPIVVRVIGDRYSIVMGERRWKASTWAGRDTIPAIIRVGMDDRTALRLAVVENFRRNDLNAMEAAGAYDALSKAGYTQEQIAEEIGSSRSAVSNLVRLLKLPQDVQDLVMHEKLPASHARSLLRFEAFPGVLSRIAALAIEKNSTARDLEAGVPFADNLSQEKLIRNLEQHRTKFNRDGCKTCRFSAYFSGGNSWSQYCLLPKEYDAKQKAAIDTEEAAAVELLRKASEQSGKVAERMEQMGITKLPSHVVKGAAKPPEGADLLKALPDLGKLAIGSYARIDNPCPKECRAGNCPCRIKATSYGSLVDICIDPHRYNGFKRAATVQKKARLKERFDVQFAQLQQTGSPEFSLRVVSILAFKAISAVPTESRRKVCNRLSASAQPLHADIAAFFSRYISWSEEAQVWPLFAQHHDVNFLIRLAAEMMAQREIDDALTNVDDSTPLLNFLLPPVSSKEPEPADQQAGQVDPPADVEESASPEPETDECPPSDLAEEELPEKVPDGQMISQADPDLIDSLSAALSVTTLITGSIKPPVKALGRLWCPLTMKVNINTNVCEIEAARVMDHDTYLDARYNLQIPTLWPDEWRAEVAEGKRTVTQFHGLKPATSRLQGRLVVLPERCIFFGKRSSGEIATEATPQTCNSCGVHAAQAGKRVCTICDPDLA